uniref:Uncharacterized protein n=1 Tax=Oryza brachyantha TaxID=4533 RepID=J3L6V7_ORYBR
SDRGQCTRLRSCQSVTKTKGVYARLNNTKFSGGKMRVSTISNKASHFWTIKG